MDPTTGARIAESAEPRPADIPPRPARRVGFLPFVSFALALAAALLCRAAAGALHGMFFGGVVFAAILVPPLVLSERYLKRQAGIAASVWLGLAAGWLAVLLDVDGTGGLWLRASALLAAFVFALWGLTSLLAAARLGSTGAAALATLIALAWLAWPVWLSPALPGHQSLTDALTRPHPLLTLDTPLLRPWSESWTVRRYFYNDLGNLNQDVQFHPPDGIAPAVILHGLIGAACLILAWTAMFPRRSTPIPAPAQDTSPTASGSSSDSPRP